MTESTCAAEHADPFRLLLVRRAAADAAGSDAGRAESSAVDEATRTLLPAATGYARFAPENCRDATISCAMERLLTLCRSIYQGKAALPPDSWEAYTITIVRNCARDEMRRDRRRRSFGVRSFDDPSESIGRTLADSLSYRRAGADVEDTAIDRVARDVRARRVGWLESLDRSGELLCVFHPGRRCHHIATGSVPKPCQHMRVVLDVLGESLTSIDPEPMTAELMARTGHDGHIQGKSLRRNMYRCADWFGWLAFSKETDADADADTLRRGFEKRLIGHLDSSGVDAPSATTVCILMNDHPGLPMPDHLVRKYGPAHRDGYEGESR